MSDLSFIVMKSAEELGSKINDHLREIRNTDTDFRIPITESRFENGEGKARVDKSIRDTDLFVLSDIGNYDVSFKMRGREHYMSPDEHFTDLKRVIAASSGHALRLSVITPLLYEARQDKRRGRESLDCAQALQELEHLNICNFITFDAHNPGIQNAVPTMPFENFYPTAEILMQMYQEYPEEMNNIVVIGPDMGAGDRARLYSEILGCDMGCFYKRRDLSKVVDGKNPIIEHTYLGGNIKNKNALIVDDMISSGSSVLEVAEELKNRGVNKVFIATTFALFTSGIEKFEKAYDDGILDKVFSTNLSYVPQHIKDKEWYSDVDCSAMIADIIDTLNKSQSTEPFHNRKSEAYKKLSLIRKPTNY